MPLCAAVSIEKQPGRAAVGSGALGLPLAANWLFAGCYLPAYATLVAFKLLKIKEVGSPGVAPVLTLLVLASEITPA